MNRFREARDKGGRYLMTQIHDDGSFGDPEQGVTEYYKVPVALMVCGMSGAASRLLDWVRRNGFAPDGDFGPRPEDTLDSYYYTYHNAWVIKGAHRLGQFDLAQRGMDFLMRFHDPESGGFYSSPTEREASTEQDLWVVSGSGWSAVYTGRLDVARGLGVWMKRMMDDQPNYPEEMWTVYSRASGLITDVRDGDDFRYVLTRDESRDQSFFHPGIAAGFLSRLYMATGEKEWLDLARRYMLFCDYVWGLPLPPAPRGQGRLGRVRHAHPHGRGQVRRHGRQGRRQPDRRPVGQRRMGMGRLGPRRLQQRRHRRAGSLARRNPPGRGIGLGRRLAMVAAPGKPSARMDQVAYSANRGRQP